MNSTTTDSGISGKESSTTPWPFQGVSNALTPMTIGDPARVAATAGATGQRTPLCTTCTAGLRPGRACRTASDTARPAPAPAGRAR